jgi:hypothetical protein
MCLRPGAGQREALGRAECAQGRLAPGDFPQASGKRSPDGGAVKRAGRY